MAKIKEYFNCISLELDILSKKSGLTNNNADIGVNRENITKVFLEKHLPRRLKAVLGGTIFGNNSIDSKQIDIIITNDIGINFEENSKMFIAVENVAGAISVKSKLNKEAIFDTLSNIASIPQIDEKIMSFKILNQGATNSFINNHPSLFIFSFEGISLEKTIEYINEYYKKNDHIPFNRYPRGIIVNKQFYILFSTQKTRLKGGGVVQENTFHGISLREEMHGYPFIQLLNSITQYVDWLPFMTLNLHEYFNDKFGLNEND